MELPDVNWLPLLPVISVTIAATVVLLLDLAPERGERHVLAWPSIIGLGVTALVSALLWNTQGTSLNGSVVLDNYALFLNLVVCGATALALLMAADYLETTDVRGGEYYAFVLFAASGMIAMVAANDLIVLFLGFEIMSIASYILAGIWREELRSNEAALKYFLIGAFATGFLLFGIALIYATTGTTRLDGIRESLGAATSQSPELLFLGVTLLLVGFAFKVSAVPFHMWTPDVYEGAPTSVTAFMAVVVKAAAFAAFGRVFLHTLAGASVEWEAGLWILAVVTMTVGNLLAITQSNIKRMLAYSSIAHAGYLLVAMVAGGGEGGSALLFYLIAYAAMNTGAFAVVAALGRAQSPNEQIEDYAGLGFRRPFLGVAMATFMLSLVGVPPLVGFVGKFYAFGAAVNEGYVGLAVIGVLNSAVSAYYYIWVIVLMYMREGGAEPLPLAHRPYLAATIGLSLASTLLFGLFPGPLMALARSAFLSLG